MNILGSKSSSKMLIRKKIQTGEETNTAKKLGDNTLDITKIQLVLLYPDILGNQAHPFSLFRGQTS